MHGIGILGYPRRISDYADQFVGYAGTISSGLVMVLVSLFMVAIVMFDVGMSVHAMASTVHIGITSGAVASSFYSTTVLTSADHLLRYYCICHTYCTECCSSAVLLVV